MTHSGPRVGIFGGAFDPPHNAHHMLARAAIDQLRLDVLHILPTGQAWHKPRRLTDGTHRLAMARLAFADLPQAQVDDRELRRSGPSYSLDTARELLAQYPGCQLFLVLGEDQARALPTWHGWRELLSIATISIAKRQDSTPARGTIDALNGAQGRFLPLQTDAMALSATAIRARAAQGESIAALVCGPVARYIDHHHLYQTA
ncbi:MAG: nicotinate (nicotinamide) nucleotide adenylyltransferase [Pseudomonadota bacterium]